MEVPATEKEVQALTGKYQQGLLLFPEGREYPIKMYDNLPLRWIQGGPQEVFSAVAFRGEFTYFKLERMRKNILIYPLVQFHCVLTI